MIRPTIAYALIASLILALSTAVLPELGPEAGGTVLAQESNNENAEGMTRADESPLDEFDPDQTSWEAWAGPLLIGIIGLILVLLIVRFSLLKKRKKTDQDR